MLARLKAQGVREVAMEVSSHALDQGRVDGVRFHSAAFTNLSRDHLDYHPSMQAYGEAKARLFAAQDSSTSSSTSAMPSAASCAKLRRRRAADGGVDRRRGDAWLAERSLEARAVPLDLRGVSLDIDGSFGEAALSTKLLGRFNAENALVVLGCLLALGVPLAEAAGALAACTAPPGRMEVIEARAPGKPMAVVDYAHTPDALAKALARCASTAAARSGACSAAAATAIPASGRSWAPMADELADRDHRHRRQSALGRSAGDHSRHHRAASSRTRRGSFTIAAQRSPPRSRTRRRGMWCSSPARATRITRSTARRAAASATGARRAGFWGSRHEAHVARGGARAAAQR